MGEGSGKQNTVQREGEKGLQREGREEYEGRYSPYPRGWDDDTRSCGLYGTDGDVGELVVLDGGGGDVPMLIVGVITNGEQASSLCH